MLLQFTDLFKRGTHQLTATITTEHSLSSYGQPVLLLSDGKPIDATSWVLMGYSVLKMSKKEAPLMEKWLGNLNLMLGGAV